MKANEKRQWIWKRLNGAKHVEIVWDDICYACVCFSKWWLGWNEWEKLVKYTSLTPIHLLNCINVDVNGIFFPIIITNKCQKLTLECECVIDYTHNILI